MTKPLKIFQPLEQFLPFGFNAEATVYENTLEEPAIGESVPVQQGIRFYAGAAVTTVNAYLIGTVYVTDWEMNAQWKSIY